MKNILETISLLMAFLFLILEELHWGYILGDAVPGMHMFFPFLVNRTKIYLFREPNNWV